MPSPPITAIRKFAIAFPGHCDIAPGLQGEMDAPSMVMMYFPDLRGRHRVIASSLVCPGKPGAK